MLTKVHARVQTPADILGDAISFVIPSYQRPYVWPDEDVIKLLMDIDKARHEGDSHYYIGTLLTSAKSDGSNCLELIDGQQRATTLFLMALAFKAQGIATPLAEFAILEGEPRLTFTIRDQVQSLLGDWLGLSDYQKPTDDMINSDPYLDRINGALQVLKQHLEKLDRQESKELADYILHKVQWVNNSVPEGIDLNRLFATMNTSGIQLEQADILKSLLFKNIKSDKAVYNGIWQACEQMENYFEQNVKKVFSGSVWKDIEPENLVEFDSELFVLPKNSMDMQKENMHVSIGELAQEALDEWTNSRQHNSKDEDDDDDDLIYCRSIVSFPLFLMHVYRIYRENKGRDIEVRMNSDRLIESFADLINSDGRDVKEFIRYLWRVRYQFDRWVIKWVDDAIEKEDRLGLTDTYLNKSGENRYIQRRGLDNDELVHLQCVRNFTGERSAQYWLTPFLGWLITDDYKKSKKNQVLELLEEIDNQLSLAQDTQKEASYQYLIGGELKRDSFDTIKRYLRQSKGTRFEHYWFQKLEYLLWKDGDKSEDKKLAKYRIVSRNSVEHVHPQNEEYKSDLDKKYLDAFGNLVLLSPGQNSSYSNQKVEKKRIDFYAKNSYDSLKLKRIFEMQGNGSWDPEKINDHESKMIAILEKHYKRR